MSTAPTPGSEALRHYLYTTGCRRQTLGAYLDGEAATCGAGDSPCDFCDDTLSWEITPPRTLRRQPHKNEVMQIVPDSAPIVPSPGVSPPLLEVPQDSDVISISTSLPGDEYGSMDDLEIPWSTPEPEGSLVIAQPSAVMPSVPPTPPNRLVQAHVVDERSASALLATLRQALSQVHGKCVGCYVFPQHPHDHSAGSCPQGLQVERCLSGLRKRIHCARDSCCFSCFLPRRECKARYTRSKCQNPQNGVLALALAVHLFHPAAHRYFRADHGSERSERNTRR